MEIKIKKPGKLFIAGEYSVVESGRKAIITSVDKFISVSIFKDTFSSVESFKCDRLKFYWNNKRLHFDDNSQKWSVIRSAIETAHSYLLFLIDEFDNLKLKIQSQMDDKSGKKYGIGSSASVTVAVIDAIFKYYKINLEKIQLFKLSSLATLANSPNNSCGDVAAISYSNFIYYRNFDHKYINDKKKKMNIYELVEIQWPLLEIIALEFPKNWTFMVGWTQKPAISSQLVKKIRDNKSKKSYYLNFQNKSDECVDNIVEAIKDKNFDLFKISIEEARKNLLELSNVYKSEIEIKKLKELTNIAKKMGYASKFSGAGGGDCGIAISENDKYYNTLIDNWAKNNINYLDINIYIGEDNV